MRDILDPNEGKVVSCSRGAQLFFWCEKAETVVEYDSEARSFRRVLPRDQVIARPCHMSISVNNLVITSGKTVMAVDISAGYPGRIASSIVHHKKVTSAYLVDARTVESPDAMFLLTDRFGEVYEIPVNAGKSNDSHVAFGHSVCSITASAFGQGYIVTGDVEGKVRVATYPGGYEILKYLFGHKAIVRHVKFVGENLLVTSCVEGNVNLWRIEESDVQLIHRILGVPDLSGCPVLHGSNLLIPRGRSITMIDLTKADKMFSFTDSYPTVSVAYDVELLENFNGDVVGLTQDGAHVLRNVEMIPQVGALVHAYPSLVCEEQFGSVSAS